MILGLTHDVFVGVLSAVLAVLILQNPPMYMRLSRDISVRRSRNGRLLYRAAFSRRRWYPSFLKGPIDMDFHARFIRGFPVNELILPIPLQKDWRPSVRGQAFVVLEPQECEIDQLEGIAPGLVAARNDGTLTLGMLFDEVEDADLFIYIFGFHRRTGTRWMCQRHYARAQIVNGKFDRHGLQVIPEKEPPGFD